MNISFGNAATLTASFNPPSGADLVKKYGSNGSLDLKQFESAVAANAPSGAKAPAGAPQPSAIFSALDTSGDGKLTASELDAGRPAPGKGAPSRTGDSRGDSSSIQSLLKLLESASNQTNASTSNATANSATTVSKSIASYLINQLKGLNTSDGQLSTSA